MSLVRAFIRLWVCAGCVVLFTAAVGAAPLLTNATFEPFVNDGNGTMVMELGGTQITRWTVVANQLAWIFLPNPWELSAQDGSAFLDLTAYPAGAPFRGITQILDTASVQDAGSVRPTLVRIQVDGAEHLSRYWHLPGVWTTSA